MYEASYKDTDRVVEDNHELAGLMAIGVDEDGLEEWQGTRKQWDEYEKLEKQIKI